MSEEHPHHGGIAVLAFGTLGIVFGDIGTSPIYAFRESFHHAELEISADDHLRCGLHRVLGADHRHLASSTC